jgi:propanol-preferring alcohol dehydrogenase
MLLRNIGPMDENPEPLELVELPTPEPGEGEILIRVTVCGVCHTELDEIEGRAAPTLLPIIPGHEVVGVVEAIGTGVTRLKPGERVGVGWIHHSDGTERENISPAFRATGRDAHGGYAEFMVAGERYAYPIPEVFSDEEAAPLLCAGGVGYRALSLCELVDGDALGLTGFGGSGHLVLQLAKQCYPSSPVYVFARSEQEQAFARELGAAWAGSTEDAPPTPPAAIIDTTPAWRPVLAALRCLAPGGRLVINAIRKESTDRALLADLDYGDQLWMEKSVKTVANVTASDIAEFLDIAAEVPIKPSVRVYPLSEANQALQALRQGHIRGAYVLKIN